MRNEINRIIEKAVDLYDVPQLRDTDIKFDIRSYNFVGQARVRTNKYSGQREYTLRLNPKAVEENYDDMLNDTIPHEIAHLVNYAKPSTGRRHNRGWKRVCLALGGNGQRCVENNAYDLDQPTLEERKINHDARRPYVYTDSTGTERRLTKVRHNKLQRTYGGYALTWRDNGGRVDGDSEWRFEKLPNVIFMVLICSLGSTLLKEGFLSHLGAMLTLKEGLEKIGRLMLGKVLPNILIVGICLALAT